MDGAALNSTAGGRPRFVSTQWGRLLLAAEAGGDPAADAAARAAWEDLYRRYCYPVYAFVRRRGHPRSEAQDLTQDFFVHLLEKNTLRRADPTKGRFRTFLLAALEYFLVDDARRAAARKRGGGQRFVLIDDALAAESAYQLATPDSQSPSRLFDSRWAATLVDSAFEQLRTELAAAGKGPLFDALKDYLAGSEDASYQQKADALGLTLPALNSAVHRLRVRYRSLLREEVGRTVADPRDVDGELRQLREALRVTA